MDKDGLIVGQNYLLTLSDWVYTPSGLQKNAVFGKVEAILSDEDTLGIKTNRGSTNWYVKIGDMLVAGCRIHYAIKTDYCFLGPVTDHVVENGVCRTYERPCNIYHQHEGGAPNVVRIDLNDLKDPS